MSGENWTTPPGYEVTEDGRVYSTGHNWRGYGRRELQQSLNSYGYPSVRITLGGVRKRIAVHRLVAHKFLGPKPSNEHEVRHLNGDKADNRACNLSWGTRAENAEDRDRHGTTVRGNAINTSKLSENDVARIRRVAPKIGPVALAREYGVTREAIYKIVSGRSWRHTNV